MVQDSEDGQADAENADTARRTRDCDGCMIADLDRAIAILDRILAEIRSGHSKDHGRKLLAVAEKPREAR